MTNNLYLGKNIENYGKIVAIAYKKPTAFTSLLDELERIGVFPVDIDTFYLSCEHVQYTLEHLKEIKRDNDFNFVLKGYTGQAVETNNIKFIPSDFGYLERKNLIKTKFNEYFVWHVPYHEKHEEKDYFGFQYENNLLLDPEQMQDTFTIRLVEPDEILLNELKEFYNIKETK